MTLTTDFRPPQPHLEELGPDESFELDRPPTWDDFHALEERLGAQALRRDGWTMFIFSFAAVALILSVIAMGFGLRAIDDAKRPARASSATAAPSPVTLPPVAAPSLVPPLAASPGPVTLSDYKVAPAATSVAPGKVTVQISNTGAVPHELLVFRSDLPPSAYPTKDGNIDEEGAGITKVSDGDNLDPGATQTRTLDLSQPGTYLFVCNLPGHFRAGMYQVVTVK